MVLRVLAPILLTLSCLLQPAMAEEESSPVAVAVGATLMGAIAFLMVLFYLMNHRDADMRRYTYMVIVNTISIFCAVLLFQGFDGILKDSITDWSEIWVVAVSMVHMAVWFGIMQFVLALFSGAIDELLPQSILSRKSFDKEKVEGNLKCFATLIAHMAGFASIQAWGELQQLSFFSSSPLAALLVPLMSMCYQIVLQQITHTIRDKVARGDDGVWDEAEEAWHQNTVEAENDVMALSVSFLTVQSLRFAIGGFLPDPEGAEDQKSNGVDVFTHHTSFQMLLLFFVGLAFLAISSLIKYQVLKEESAGEEETVQDADGVHQHAINHDRDLHAVKERIQEVLIDTFGMGFSWCGYYSCLWMMAAQRDDGMAGDMMLIKLVAALVSAFLCFSVIYWLDKLADSDCTGEEVDEMIIKSIEFFGILVGFAWEQTFDVAIENLSEGMFGELAEIGKLLIAIFCAIIIVPAWRWWILPMLIFRGWEYGFVLDDSDLALEAWEKVLKTAKWSEIQHALTEKALCGGEPKHEHGHGHGQGAAGHAHKEHHEPLKEPLLEKANADNNGHAGHGDGNGAAAAAAAASVELEGLRQRNLALEDEVAAQRQAQHELAHRNQELQAQCAGVDELERKNRELSEQVAGLQKRLQSCMGAKLFNSAMA
eukprot:TRINITY_DN6832_c0_g3_i2.p2 TRINITY_DN6832_c0_g3~~TRINITY_DN6832_c0_g3_i2.p2  ORF type:complete len:653 (-),score=166.63 TRINITY_DN6832_c0_g3_i2:117-2075(-)